MNLTIQTLFLIKMSNFEIKKKVVSNSKNLPIPNNYLKNSNIHFCISNILFVYLNFFNSSIDFDLVILQNSFRCQRIT